MRQFGSTNIGFYNWYNITFQYTKITLIKPPRAYSSLLLMIFFYNSDTLEVEILTNSYLNWNRIKRRLWVKMSGIWTPFAFRPNWGILSSVASVDLRFGATKMDSTVYFMPISYLYQFIYCEWAIQTLFKSQNFWQKPLKLWQNPLLVWTLPFYTSFKKSKTSFILDG